jgi:hypothetical protein
LQGLAHLLRRHQAQKRRLREIDLEYLAEHRAERGITREILKIREDKFVLFFRRRSKVSIPKVDRDPGGQDRHDGNRDSVSEDRIAAL